MGKRKKEKKVSVRKEKYAKFKKEKKGVNLSSMNLPDPDPEFIKQRQEDDMNINKFLRFNKNAPIKTLREKNLKRK